MIKLQVEVPRTEEIDGVSCYLVDRSFVEEKSIHETTRTKMNKNTDSAALLDLLVRGSSLSEMAVAVLSNADEVELRLINASGRSLVESVEYRVRIFREVNIELQERGVAITPIALWSRYLPLAELLVHWSNNTSSCLIGIAGVPGTGKTSLATILATIAKKYGSHTAAVSLDDFYLTPRERHNLGHKWRAVPGTHDLAMLRQFVTEVKSGGKRLAIPRYDTRAERRLEPVICEQPQLVLLEGWFVGASVSGYEFLAEALDYLLYLDADLEWSHQSRVNREARIRFESNGRLGLSEEETERFWQEALLPGAIRWVLPLKQTADAVIEVDADYAIRSVVIRTAAPGDSPRV